MGAARGEAKPPAGARSLQFSDSNSLDRTVSPRSGERLRSLPRRLEPPPDRKANKQARDVRHVIGARAEADEKSVERSERA